MAAAAFAGSLLAHTNLVSAQAPEPESINPTIDESWTTLFATAQDPGDDFQPPPRRPGEGDDGFDQRSRGDRPPGPPPRDMRRGQNRPPGRGPDDFQEGPGRRGEGPPQQQPPKERIQEAVKFIENHFPRMHIEMMKLRERNPQRFRQRMRRILPDIMHMMDVYAHDPQMGSLMIRERQLDMRIRHAVFRYHKTEDESEKDALQEEIKEAVNDVFDVQLQRRELEITSLKLRVDELEAGLAEQQDMRQQLIRQRIKHMLENKPPAMRDGPGDEGESDLPPPDDSPPPGE